MKLGDIRAPKGAKRKRKRLGCGVGSGKGKTSGKGHKGQKSRSGAKISAGFEGGQMPIQMRLPKIGGTKPFRKVVYQVVNLSDLARRGISGDVGPEMLRELRLIRSVRRPVKVLGRGEATGALIVRAHAFSASASEKIKQAGGSTEVISFSGR